MELAEFVKGSICQMTSPSFEMAKEMLLREKFISFSVMDSGKVGVEAFAEKVCDYFEMAEIKNGQPFEKQIETFMNNIDAIVKPKIVEAPQKKGESASAVVPRARRYYEKVLTYKDNKTLTVQRLLDYTRIMMSLYIASVNQGNKQIENFEYSAKCLDVQRILEEMKKEGMFDFLQFINIRNVVRKRFDLKEKYASDSCTFVILISILYTILNMESKEVEH